MLQWFRGVKTDDGSVYQTEAVPTVAGNQISLAKNGMLRGEFSTCGFACNKLQAVCQLSGTLSLVNASCKCDLSGDVSVPGLPITTTHAAGIHLLQNEFPAVDLQCVGLCDCVSRADPNVHCQGQAIQEQPCRASHQKFSTSH